jgi:hypothetical protein
VLCVELRVVVVSHTVGVAGGSLRRGSGKGSFDGLRVGHGLSVDLRLDGLVRRRVAAGLGGFELFSEAPGLLTPSGDGLVAGRPEPSGPAMVGSKRRVASASVGACAANSHTLSLS